MSMKILIRLLRIQMDDVLGQYGYFSVGREDNHVFSSCVEGTGVLNDHLIVEVGTQLPSCVYLHRWHNHIIIFSHPVDLTDLRTRPIIKRKQQTRPHEVLEFTLTLLEPHELIFSPKYSSQITQHYLILSDLHIIEKHPMPTSTQPSFFLLRTQTYDVVMPITHGSICVKLPETLNLFYLRNGAQEAQSGTFKAQELEGPQCKVLLEGKGDKHVAMKLHWGVNMYEAKPENNLLMQAHEILIYDLEVKFDNYNEYTNAKVKFVYGNKAFQLESEWNSPKPAKIKKLIHFFIKSEDEEIAIIVERNLKVTAHSRFYTDELTEYTVNAPKRKFIDSMNGRIVGSIKFKCEKAKNLSTPSNNQLWKSYSKKKINPNSYVLAFSQFTIEYEQNQHLFIILKTESHQKIVQNVPNLDYFDLSKQILEDPVIVNVRIDQNVYMMVRKTGEEGSNTNETDFIGIAVINLDQLRLGMNVTDIPFFKNQTKVLTANCLINKIVGFPFMKPVFQPELLYSHVQKTLTIAVFMKKIVFTPFYYTYRYDNKNEVYCIVEVNRVKKVLIMESSAHDPLTLVSSAGSDSLSFFIEHAEFLKIKITFLVSDIGQEEEIYGSAILKMKTHQLFSKGVLEFNQVALKNQFDTEVGVISTDINRHQQTISQHYEPVSPHEQGELPPIQQQKSVFKSEIRGVKNQIAKINESLEKVERSRDHKNYVQVKRSVNPIRNLIASNQYGNQSIDIGRSPRLHQKEHHKQDHRYEKDPPYRNPKRAVNRAKINKSLASSPLKLPAIQKKDRNNSLENLVRNMHVRKRTARGGYQDPGKQMPSTQKLSKKESFNKIVRNRSLTEKKQQGEQISMKIQKYQQQLKDLKNDIHQQDKKLNQSLSKKGSNKSKPKREMELMQFQDNEFANLPEP